MNRMRLKGLYIEDDKKNICVTKKLFEQEGFDLEALDELPVDLENLYPLILEKNIDFLLIDHELNKLVSYTGFDALNEIRKHDRTIYAVLLTNFEVEDFKEEFGSYDLEVNKSELSDDQKLNDIAAKIRRACERIVDSKVLAQVEEQQKIEQQKLELLKQIEKRLAEKTTD